MYGGRNPPCSPACALLVDLITLPAQAGDTELQAWSQLFSSQPQLDTQASVSEVVGGHQSHTFVVHHFLDGGCLFVSWLAKPEIITENLYIVLQHCLAYQLKLLIS